jgi:hypothetical protein
MGNTINLREGVWWLQGWRAWMSETAQAWKGRWESGPYDTPQGILETILL